MIPELTYLTYSVILLLVHVMVQATFSDLSKGLGWALGAQDDARDQSVIAGRIQRALRNFLETYPAFIALVVALSLTELANETSALGAMIWFWARVAYVPAYASAIPLARSIAWFASIAGLVLMLWPLLTGGSA